MIYFEKIGDKLLAIFETNYSGWIYEKFKINDSAKIKGVYKFFRGDLHKILNNDSFNSSDTQIVFLIATKSAHYYKFKRHVFSINKDLYIHESIKIEDRFFRAHRQISIVPKLCKVINEDIYISPNGEKGISVNQYKKILKGFPDTYELTRYSEARIEAILNHYFMTCSNFVNKYEKLLNKKITFSGQSIKVSLKNYEKEKYSFIYQKLIEMLDNQESYNEKDWQTEILDILPLIFPKYIYILPEMTVKDYYSHSTRRIDFGIIDVNGNVDIIEIKRPKWSNLLYKNVYRGNFVPSKILSDTIMQIEKYLFHLVKSGKNGENHLNDKYKSILKNKVKINIINPKGIVIIGRDKNLKSQELKDLEIIKRQYNNIIDIITYDDLLQRVNILIEMFS